MKTKNYIVEYTKKAKNDVDEVYDTIVSKYYDIFAAKKAADKINYAIYNIIPFPEAYPLIEDEFLKLKGIRVKKIRKYNIYYIVKDDVVVILMVSNSKRSFMNVVDELVKRI